MPIWDQTKKTPINIFSSQQNNQEKGQPSKTENF